MNNLRKLGLLDKDFLQGMTMFLFALTAGVWS